MSTNPLYMEHRWGSRVELFAPIDVVTATGSSFSAMMRNASLSGALVETDTRLPVLARIALKPQAPGTDWMQACVVRADGRGFGGFAVEWLDPVLRSVSALLALRDLGPQFDQSATLLRESVSWQLLDRLQRTPTGI